MLKLSDVMGGRKLKLGTGQTNAERKQQKLEPKKARKAQEEDWEGKE